MSCKCCKPVVINTGGGGTGAVESVTGTGVVNVTPTTGDSVVSIIPGTIPGAVLVTNPGETAAVWGPHLSSGESTLNITASNNADSLPATSSAMWTRIGDIVTVTGDFLAGMIALGNDASVDLSGLPFPMTTPALNPIAGTVSGTSTGGAMLVGRIGNASPTVDAFRVFYSADNVVDSFPLQYTFSYRAVPLT